MTPVEVTERAAADVVGLVDYLAEANAAVARNFIDGFERAVERLGTFPESGAFLHDGGTGNERMVLVYPARVSTGSTRAWSASCASSTALVTCAASISSSTP